MTRSQRANRALRTEIARAYQPVEPNDATPRPVHTRAYEKGMGLLFIIGTVAAVFAVFYVLSYFD